MTVPSERREQYNTGVYYQTVDKVTAENRSVFVPYVDKDGKVVKNFYYSDVYSTGEKTYILYDVANDQYRVCYDQNAKPIIYTYTEYSWDRKTFNQLGKWTVITGSVRTSRVWTYSFDLCTAVEFRLP